MKPVLKYSVSLFLLLLIGYSQMFAHVYRGAIYSPIKTLKNSSHDASVVIKSAEVEEVYIEEDEEKEDEHFLVKKFSDDTERTSLSSEVHEYYFFQRIKSSLSFRERIANSSSLISPQVIHCVFRI